MRRITRADTTTIRLIALVSALFLAATLCRAQISVVDDAHNRITVEKPARRIIAVAPHLAELAYAAGAGKWLIATVRGADYPPDVLALPVVGDAAGLDFERMRRLEPDLILAWRSGNKPADLDRLTRNGAATLVMEPRTLRDIARHLRIIGELAGTQTVAEDAATRFEHRLQQLRARYSDASRLDVVVEIWHQPLFTVGPTHALSDALRVCGAHNALQDYPLLAGPVPLEAVLAADADVMLSLTGMRESDARAHWHEYLPPSADKPLAVVSLQPDLLTRPGPRMLDGVELLCTRLDQLRAKLRVEDQTGSRPVSNDIRS